jgi:hypothetical protein
MKQLDISCKLNIFLNSKLNLLTLKTGRIRPLLISKKSLIEMFYFSSIALDLEDFKIQKRLLKYRISFKMCADHLGS